MVTVAEIKDRPRRPAKGGGARIRALPGRASTFLEAAAMDVVQTGRTPLQIEFEIQDQVDGLAYPTSLSADAQRQFQADFYQQLGTLEAWLQGNGWLTGPLTRPDPAGSAAPPRLFDLSDTDLRVCVSNRFRRARSLTPAATGRRGRIEFPKRRIAIGEADIVHELAHVFFPNGNRMLAEGLAVYLQQKLGGNPAYPNFGKDLDQSVRELLPHLGPDGLAQIDLPAFDAISTPDDLSVKIGESWHDESATYLIAGSFVKFLIESFGPDRFYQLYMQTRLLPLGRNGGEPDRWLSFYGRPLEAIAADWKRRIADPPAHAALGASHVAPSPLERHRRGTAWMPDSSASAVNFRTNRARDTGA